MKKAIFFLGLLISQIVILGLALFLAYLFGIVIPLSSTGSSALFVSAELLMLLIILAIPIVSAILIYRDVKKIINQGVDAWMPTGWALVALFFWFPGLTIYLYLRKFFYKIELQGRSKIT